MSLVKTQAVFLRHTPFSEQSIIIHAYTKEHGLLGFIVQNYKSKRAPVKPSFLLPLTLADLEYDYQHNKQLHRIKESKATPPLIHVHMDMIRMSIAQFIAELMFKLIREQAHKDEALFDFLFHHIQLLDLIDHTQTPNFAAYFICRLSSLLGITPKGVYSEYTNGFNTKDAVFELYNPVHLHHVEPDASSIISDFIHEPFEICMSLKMHQQLRQHIIRHMLWYYSNQLHISMELQSYKILNEVLAS